MWQGSGSPRRNGERLERLAESIGETILFAGAGLSLPAYPLWHPFLQGYLDQAVSKQLMAEAECLAIKQVLGSDLPKLTSYLQESRDHARYFQKAISDTFMKVKDPTEAHIAAAKAPFKGVITTNFDSGLKDAIAKHSDRIHDDYDGGSREHLATWIEGRAFDDAGRYPIMSLHGNRKNPGEIVFSEEEFILAYESSESEQLQRMVNGILRGHVLFAGFGFSDPWLTRILRLKRHRETETERNKVNRMAIVGLEAPTDEKVVVAEFFYLKLGIEPILYGIDPGDRAEGRPDRELLEILDHLRRLAGTIDPPISPAEPPDLALEVDGHTLPFVMVGPGTLPDNGSGRPVTIDYRFAIGASPIPAALAARLLGRAPPRDGYAPAHRLSRDDAEGIAGALGDLTGRRLRLPTEAEWELAARLALKDGPEPDAVDAASPKTRVPAAAPVSSGSGLQHMFGFIWEWVADTGDGDRRVLPTDGSAQRITTNQGIQKGGKVARRGDAAAILARRIITRPHRTDDLCGVRPVLLI